MKKVLLGTMLVALVCGNVDAGRRAALYKNTAGAAATAQEKPAAINSTNTSTTITPSTSFADTSGVGTTAANASTMSAKSKKLYKTERAVIANFEGDAAVKGLKARIAFIKSTNKSDPRIHPLETLLKQLAFLDKKREDYDKASKESARSKLKAEVTSYVKTVSETDLAKLLQDDTGLIEMIQNFLKHASTDLSDANLAN